MRILFTELARSELIDAVAYYEMEVPGLGETFKDEMVSATMRISQFPQAWSIERGVDFRIFLVPVRVGQCKRNSQKTSVSLSVNNSKT